MASKFDPQQFTLRRFEAQMHYHAAYMYWGLRGTLAERWGHGPHFGAYGVTDQELQLTRQTQPSDLVAVAGLKRSVFIAEGSSAEMGNTLAVSWLEDVIVTLKPRRITRIILRNLFAYPAADPARVSNALMKDFPSVAEFLPSGVGTRHGGLQYQLVDTREEFELRRSATFGVYGPAQQREYFLLPNNTWQLGFHHMIEWATEDGIEFPDQILSQSFPVEIEDVRSEALRNVSRVMSHA